MTQRGEQVGNLSNDQIEYPDEDPWIRQTFEAELAKKGLTTLMADQAYKNYNFKWSYDEGDWAHGSIARPHSTRAGLRPTLIPDSE